MAVGAAVGIGGVVAMGAGWVAEGATVGIAVGCGCALGNADG
jgi:hypothetical protein